jgi:hypothetical protein
MHEYRVTVEGTEYVIMADSFPEAVGKLRDQLTNNNNNDNTDNTDNNLDA